MKNSHILFLSLFFFLAIGMSSCDKDIVRGRGEHKTESRALTGFNRVEFQMAGELEIRKDSISHVDVYDYENLIPYIECLVENNTLIIRTDPSEVIFRNSDAKITVFLPEFEHLTLAGSGNAEIVSVFPELSSVNLTGSGNVKCLDAANSFGDLMLTISGSGSMTFAGAVNTLTANITGSGNLELFDLVSQHAHCMISGSGNIYVNAVQTLDAVITGSGNVEYMGNPIVTQNITGSGTVRRK